MIADAMAPAGKPDVGAILGEGQGAAGMGAVAMHDYRVFFASNGVEPRCLTEKGGRGKSVAFEPGCPRQGQRDFMGIITQMCKIMVTSCV
jgi:hypothetical protein